MKQVALFPRLSSEMTKYIVVSGGVISGIGKGVIGVYSFMISKTGQKTQDISEQTHSLFYRSLAQNDWPQGYSNQD